VNKTKICDLDIMQINARVIPGSHIDLMWRNRSAIGGDLCGARFRLKGGQFVASDISSGALDHLLDHPCVVVEFLTEPVGQVTTA
jgi:hypothetical protein